MSRSLRRGALAAVLALSIAPLAACAAGGDAQTLQIQPDTVQTAVGDIKIQNAVIITEPSGTGPASVTARLFNNGVSAETLTGITVQGAKQDVKLTALDGKSGPLTIPGNGSIALGGPGNPSAVAPDGVTPGNVQTVVFTFKNAGQVTVTPTVVPATHYFAGYGPSVAAVPSAMPSAGASGGPSAHPSGSATARPGTHPSGGASAPASGVPSASASTKH